MDQNARQALKLADRGYVLETGQLTVNGAAHELLEDPAVKAAYLGA
jgi:branched-chain amino acid transport system ATP-binding protein